MSNADYINVHTRFCHRRTGTPYLTVEFHAGTNLATVKTENTQYIVKADNIHEHVWRHEVTDEKTIARCSCGLDSGEIA